MNQNAALLQYLQQMNTPQPAQQAPQLTPQQMQQVQTMLLQQQLAQQQAAQQPQPGIVDQLGNKAGNALGERAGSWLQNQIFGEPTPTPGATASTPTTPTSGGLTDWMSNLFGGDSGAAPATPSIAQVSALGDFGSGANAMMDAYSGVPGLGLTGAAPATQTGAQMLGSSISSGLGGLGVGAQTAGAVGSTLGYGIPIAGGLYSGYNLAQNMMDNKKDPGGGAMAGAGLGGSLAALGAFGALGPAGILAAALIGGAGGAGLGMFGGNKDKDQLARDAVRAQMKEVGFLGPDKNDYNLTLADGSVFDIGKDGETKNYNVDFSRQGIGDVVGAVNPLAAIMSGGDAKLNSDFAGYFTNAASGSGDPYANARALYEKAGLDHNSAYSNVWNLFNAGKLDAAKRDAYLNGVDQVFGANAYAKTGPQAGGNFTPQAPGFGIPAPQQPAAPKPEIQKPAQTGLLAPLPQNKPTPAGVGLTAGPRPQPMGMSPQAGQLAQQMGMGGAQIQGGPNMIDPQRQQQQLQDLMNIGAKPQIMRPLKKPGQTGLLAQIPQQGRGPIRLAR